MLIVEMILRIVLSIVCGYYLVGVAYDEYTKSKRPKKTVMDYEEYIAQKA